MNRPNIVFTNPIPEVIKSRIQLTNEQFVKLVLNDRISLIFSYYTDPNRTNHDLYVVKEGVFFITSRDRNNYKNLADFYDIKEGGFTSFNQYLEALKYGISNFKEFLAFKDSKFFGSSQSHYKEFLEGRKGDFKSPEDYRDAKRYGNFNSEEYYEFKYSKYHNYEDYIKAKGAGFREKSEFDEAISLGIESYSDYLKFKNSGFVKFENYSKALKLGFENRHDYNIARDLGHKNDHAFSEYLDKRYNEIETNLNKIRKDAYDAVQGNQLEKYIQLKWLLLEELAKKLYLKVYKEEYKSEEKLILDQVLIKIEEKLNKYIFDREKLNKWFFLQKRIAQNRAVLNESHTQKAKKFFDDLYKNLEDTFKSL
jgi:hypothetical protein